nr:penicillin-binding transpeptidase domain-containing protein [Longimicrobium terrae]
MQLTLCANPTRQAWSLLTATGLNGTVIIQDVKTGGVVSYVATGRAEDPPFGIKHYAPPGSVFKLAFSAIWWDHDLGETRMSCPPYVQVGRARIRNFESHEYASLTVPTGMLTVSCNTAAVNMVFALRRQLGVETIRDDLQKFGFVTYTGKPPAPPRDFWNTASDAWTQRMTPPPVRVRFLAKLTDHELGQIAIGQGPVDATPMGISRFIQAIGNDGVMMQPTLESARLGEGAEGRRIMKQTTSARLQNAMKTVVDTGTAQVAKAIIARTGWDLGGKTGTADVAGARNPDAWFAGLMFGPDGRARYSVVVYLQHGGQGGRMPARIAAEMTRFMAREAGTPVQPARQASSTRRGG